MDSGPNWLGLLKWTIANASDGTVPSTATAMTEEDKKFLEQVMKECVKDEPARMNEIMLSLVQFLEAGSVRDRTDEILGFLEELRDIVEQIDMAQIFVKFGGLECLFRLLEIPELDSGIISSTSSVLGALSQNNIKVQEEFLKKEGLNKLAVVFHNSSVAISSKVLFAMSCACRNHQQSEQLFCDRFASSIFTKALESQNNSLISRALYLGRALLFSDFASAERRDHLSPLFVPAAFAFLNSSNIDVREAVFSLLEGFIGSGAGRAALHSCGGEDEARAALVARAEIIGVVSSAESEEDRQFESEQNQQERDTISRMLSLLSSPPPVPRPQEPAFTSSTGSTSPVLLLQPPPSNG